MRRLITLLLLAAWVTPSAHAVGVGLHVAVDHHAVDHHAVDRHPVDRHPVDRHGADEHPVSHSGGAAHSHSPQAADAADEEGARADGDELRRAPHRHQLTSPESGPPAIRSEVASSMSAGELDGVVTIELARPARSSSGWDALGANRHRGPPPDLFYVHCSLLR